jgi:two-component system nitrogen regulation response regulator NtrX
MENNEKTPIFIVDDDQGILDSFDAMLGDDYHLVMVDNGTDAMELIDQKRPRLLFLDIKMPKPDGLEILARIREKGLATTVVVVTALFQNRYQKIAEKYGIYRYLQKPLDVNEVEDIAREVIH